MLAIVGHSRVEERNNCRAGIVIVARQPFLPQLLDKLRALFRIELHDRGKCFENHGVGLR